jgi:branched-chain amino acid transport system ATP-binding protein
MSLVAEGVSVRFGGLAAIDGVSFTLEPGEIVGLIGPNGAGKTTLVNVLSGFQRPSAGEVRLEERRFVGAAPDAFARAGIARTFQAVRLFKQLSVSENLEVSLVANGLSRSRARERAKALLAEFLPGDRGRMPAGALTYGEERKVGIARTLALEPRYLLLDEPAAGMAAAEVEDLRGAIVRIRAAYGCGILVVEHNMALIFALCDRIHVLGSGRTLAVGSPDEISANTKVREAYLGVTENISV